MGRPRVIRTSEEQTAYNQRYGGQGRELKKTAHQHNVHTKNFMDLVMSNACVYVSRKLQLRCFTICTERMDAFFKSDGEFYAPIFKIGVLVSFMPAYLRDAHYYSVWTTLSASVEVQSFWEGIIVRELSSPVQLHRRVLVGQQRHPLWNG